MEPSHNAPQINPERAPSLPPVMPEYRPEVAPVQPERQPMPHEREPAPSASPQQLPPVQQPVALPVPPVPVQPMPAAPAQVQVTGVPDVAADDDQIEKEWVDKVKQVIGATLDDPHRREKEIKQIQREYLRKRYGKELP